MHCLHRKLSLCHSRVGGSMCQALNKVYHGNLLVIYPPPTAFHLHYLGPWFVLCSFWGMQVPLIRRDGLKRMGVLANALGHTVYQVNLYRSYKLPIDDSPYHLLAGLHKSMVLKCKDTPSEGTNYYSWGKEGYPKCGICPDPTR